MLARRSKWCSAIQSEWKHLWGTLVHQTHWMINTDCSSPSLEDSLWGDAQSLASVLFLHLGYHNGYRAWGRIRECLLLVSFIWQLNISGSSSLEAFVSWLCMSPQKAVCMTHDTWIANTKPAPKLPVMLWTLSREQTLRSSLSYQARVFFQRPGPPFLPHCYWLSSCG